MKPGLVDDEAEPMVGIGVASMTLASTAMPSPPTSPACMQPRITLSKTWRKMVEVVGLERSA